MRAEAADRRDSQPVLRAVRVVRRDTSVDRVESVESALLCVCSRRVSCSVVSVRRWIEVIS